jgi:ATP-dependent DNA helicase UvrD/PcrA
VITARIINLLITQKIDPRTIIALTFTNKAAGEMKERINRFVPDGIKPFIGTFHSYCLQLLKTNADYLDHPQFSILDADDQQQLLNSIIKRAGIEKRISAKNLSYQISLMKNNLGNSNSAAVDQLSLQLLHEYEREKKKSKCLDFDDLLLEVLKLFNKYPDFKQQHHQMVRHVLVDEYQDTNITQHALLKSIAQDAENELAIDSLCAVGDEDQSIYSWRGATVTNMLHFQKDFPQTTLIKIEQNYRSAEPILHVANHVIKQNKQRNPKTLWSEKKARDRVRIMHCMSGYQEGQAIVQLAKQLQRKKDEQIAILYRAHYQSRTLEEALIRNSIPYKIIGGIQFYERKEIKDMLAYLRLIANPFDRISFFRIINCPLRGLGDKFQELFYEHWDKQPFYTFADCLQQMINEKLITGNKKTGLEAFLKLFKNRLPSDSPSKSLQELITATQYNVYLQSSFEKQEAETKIENVKELIRATHHFEQTGINSIDQFLQEVALMQEKAAIQEDKKEIKLMTLHAAKGLEFDTIVLSGLEEGIFPSQRSSIDPESIEEERRLFYVGITRAKERLLLMHARYRYTFGSMTDQLSSRFLDEIPQELASKYEATYWNDTQLQAFFADWLSNKTVHVLTFGSAHVARAESTIESHEQSIESVWKKYQPVSHEKFGLGIIKKVEKQGENTFVTAQFKVGVKKIKSTFLQKV